MAADLPAGAQRHGPDEGEVSRRLLREGGSRCTEPRVRVLEAVRSHGGHLTAAQIQARVTAGGRRVDLSTVYRTVERLMGLGLLHSLRGPGGELTFGMAGEPHHHAVCAGCGAVAEFPVALLDDGLSAAAAHTGFRVDTVVLSGRCPACRGTG
ncbi:Fur family transcriptional regulator [Kitasatospora sp. SolWspMP-SS2h]|uniref:Fur family transcriptional regulator n=1 Tax=Kitasatospora sp. SolWspMP-SS2h TaxID=1305729 RepID=UPI001313FEBC|nr:Fur family transcriptional regulator [Kitasatospora sp. SolWspMP-SS2h]